MEASWNFKSFLQGDIADLVDYAPPRLMPRRVLLIDNDPTLGSQIEAAFAERQLFIDHAVSAESATILIEELDYAAILLDIQASRQTGLDLLRNIGERHPSTPVVIITAYLPDYLRDALTDLPAVKLIVPKPSDPRALAAAVAALLTTP